MSSKEGKLGIYLVILIWSAFLQNPLYASESSSCKPTIAIVAPSETPHTFYEPAKVERMLHLIREHLESDGRYRAHFVGRIHDTPYYGNGPARERAQALMAAFLDPGVSAILSLVGGSTAYRLLPYIDFDLIRDNPKAFIGKSDITNLLLAISQKSHIPVFHGPNAHDLVSAELNADKAANDIIPATTEARAFFWKMLHSRDKDYPIVVPNRQPFVTIRPGVAEGELVGGNLTVIAHMLGLPFAPNFDGKILFLEDVGNTLDEFGRAFEFLLYHGKLKHIKGLIFTSISDVTELVDDRRFGKHPNPGAAWFQALIENLKDDPRLAKDIPIAFGYSIGHIPDNMMVPIGVNARLDTHEQKITILESPFD